jgi:hypothetical protein
LLLCVVASTSVASASQPTGQTFGAWYVTSVASISGTEGDDASVTLTQGEYPDILQASWTQGGRVSVRIDIKGCHGDAAFEARYSVETVRWLKQSRREIQARLYADFTTWLDQAALSCESRSGKTAFKIGRLEEAVGEFDDRLRYFAAG